MKSRLAAAALTVTLAWPVHARAGDAATAQALFDQARALMQEERWDEACPKLEESQRLDPAGGTLLHLALCRERQGRVASAWAHYQDALAQARADHRRDRAKIAEQRLAVLAPRLPRLRVRVAKAVRDLPRLRIVRDDVEVGPAQWGEELPIDPGDHTLRAEADGHVPWTAKVTIAEAEEITIEVPALERRPEESPAAPPAPADDAARGQGQRTLGLATAGVGAAGLVAGAVLGVVSLAKKSEADDACRPPDRRICTAAGVEAGDAAIAAGDAATIAFVAGGVLVAAGAALYFTAPKAGTVGITPVAGPRGASLVLGGRFW